MKKKTIVLTRISLILFGLVTMLVAFASAKEPVSKDRNKQVSEKIPQSARFDLKNIKADRYKLVGRLSIQRRFMGTRATPPFQDVVQFHCFNGEELKFSSFTDPELEKSLLKRLTNGYSLPVMMTVQFQKIRVGHDGINMSERLVAKVESCQQTTADSISAAAKEAKFDVADSDSYLAELKPDAVKDGIAVSLGKIYARSKVTPRGSAFSIHGIRVFNTTPEKASLEITEVTIEQDGRSQQCILSKRSQAPNSWEVEAASWSDGIYENGKMPRVLWMFDPSSPIKPEKKVTVTLKLKLNGNKLLTLKRAIDPM